MRIAHRLGGILEFILDYFKCLAANTVTYYTSLMVVSALILLGFHADLNKYFNAEYCLVPIAGGFFILGLFSDTFLNYRKFKQSIKKGVDPQKLIENTTPRDYCSKTAYRLFIKEYGQKA